MLAGTLPNTKAAFGIDSIYLGSVCLIMSPANNSQESVHVLTTHRAEPPNPTEPPLTPKQLKNEDDFFPREVH